MKTLTLPTDVQFLAKLLCVRLAQGAEFYVLASNTVSSSTGTMEVLDTTTDIDNIKAVSEKYPLCMNQFYSTEDGDMGFSLPDALLHANEQNMAVLKKNLRFALSLLGIVTPHNTVNVESLTKEINDNRHAIGDIVIPVCAGFDVIENDVTKKDVYGENLIPVIDFRWTSEIELHLFTGYMSNGELTGSLDLIISSKHTSEKFVCPIEVSIEALANAVL